MQYTEIVFAKKPTFVKKTNNQENMGAGIKVLINFILILSTIVVGFFLHKTGKPYSSAMLAAHKFLTVGFAVFITFMLIGFLKTHSPGNIFTWMVVISTLSLAALLISGGLLSVDKYFDAMQILHRIATGLFVISAGVVFLILLKNS